MRVRFKVYLLYFWGPNMGTPLSNLPAMITSLAIKLLISESLYPPSVQEIHCQALLHKGYTNIQKQKTTESQICNICFTFLHQNNLESREGVLLYEKYFSHCIRTSGDKQTKIFSFSRTQTNIQLRVWCLLSSCLNTHNSLVYCPSVSEALTQELKWLIFTLLPLWQTSKEGTVANSLCVTFYSRF